MAEEDEEMTIRTIFDLEEYNRTSGQALFKQRPPITLFSRFHHWAMDESDWDALGRPVSFVMTLSPQHVVTLDSENEVISLNDEEVKEIQS